MGDILLRKLGYRSDKIDFCFSENADLGHFFNFILLFLRHTSLGVQPGLPWMRSKQQPGIMRQTVRNTIPKENRLTCKRSPFGITGYFVSEKNNLFLSHTPRITRRIHPQIPQARGHTLHPVSPAPGERSSGRR